MTTARWVVVAFERKHYLEEEGAEMHIGPFTSEALADDVARRINESYDTGPGDGFGAYVRPLIPVTGWKDEVRDWVEDTAGEHVDA